MKDSYRAVGVVIGVALVYCLDMFIRTAIVYWSWNTISPLFGGVSINVVQSLAVVLVIAILRSIFRQRSPE